MTLLPGHLPPEQRNVLRAVALAYRRLARNRDPSPTLAESEGQAVDARHGIPPNLSHDTRSDLEVSKNVLRMIAAAINADARWFWQGTGGLGAGSAAGQRKRQLSGVLPTAR